MSARPPYVERAAIVAGWPAYVIAQLLPRDRVAARLLAKGMGDYQREQVLVAIDAIEQAGAAWHADAAVRAATPTTDVGSPELPEALEDSASAPMTATVSTSEAARALRVSDRRVRQLIDARELPARREGRQWRVDAAALAELAATRRQEAE